jgi:hypothetical protein
MSVTILIAICEMKRNTVPNIDSISANDVVAEVKGCFCIDGFEWGRIGANEFVLSNF